jgi:hypothetical protein
VIFCPAIGSITPSHAPRDKPHVGSFAGAACLKRFVAIHAPRKNSAGSLGCDPKRLPSSHGLAACEVDDGSLKLDKITRDNCALFAAAPLSASHAHRTCSLPWRGTVFGASCLSVIDLPKTVCRRRHPCELTEGNATPLRSLAGSTLILHQCCNFPSEPLVPGSS